jgi:hypothetical protein
LDDRLVFVVGSPRSGTSFTASAIGDVSGFADLGEVNALKAVIPTLYDEPIDSAARSIRAILTTAQRIGFVGGMRAIEQTPESTFVMSASARAFPHARFVHLIRDGRDVACSLIERGWLQQKAPGVARAVTGGVVDDAGQPYGMYARFWVEPERRAEFGEVSEARRAAWAWRRYTQTALDAATVLPGRVLQIRYERLGTENQDVARELALFLDAPEREREFEAALSGAHSRSLKRWKRDLDETQLADIEAEAGALLTSLGYSG